MRRIVIDLFAPHRTHDANVIGDATDLREELVDFLSRFAKAFEVELRAETHQLLVLQLRDLLPFGEGFRHRFAVHLRQVRFVIKGFQMRRASGLIQKDHPFGFGCMMQRIDHAF